MRLRILKTASFRAAAASILILMTSILLIGVFFFINVRRSVLEELRSRVEQEVRVLLKDYGEDGLNELTHDIRERLEQSRGDRLFYFLQNTQGKVVFDALPQIPEPSGWHEVELAVDRKGVAVQPVLLYSTTLANGYRLGVGASLDNLRRVERVIFSTVILAVLLTPVLGVCGGLLLSQRFLNRIDRIRSAAERIGRGNLSERIESSGSGDEFDQLVAIMNAMLERIESLVENVKGLSARVAHELRTPLGHLRQDLEALLKSESVEAQRTLVEECLTKVDEALEIFGALLRIAELETGAPQSSFARVELSPLLQELAAVYLAVAGEHGQQLSTDLAEGLSCHGDRRLLLQLFSNLLENAIRHSGRGSVIALKLEPQGDEVLVTVEDNGRGLSLEEERALRRKVSNQGGPESAAPGRGVGLSLVAAIAGVHGARVELERREPGVKVSVVFPPGMFVTQRG